MATSPDTEFSLAQRIKRNNNDLTPVKEKPPKKVCTFPSALLSTDDTVLASLGYDCGDPADVDTNFKFNESDIDLLANRENNNVNNGFWNISCLDSVAEERVEKMDLFDDDLDAFALSAVYKTTQVRREIEKIFDTTAQSSKRLHDVAVTDDLEVEDIVWQDESFLNTALSEIEIAPDNFEDVPSARTPGDERKREDTPRESKISISNHTNIRSVNEESAKNHSVEITCDGASIDSAVSDKSKVSNRGTLKDPGISILNHPVAKLPDGETMKDLQIKTSNDPDSRIPNKNSNPESASKSMKKKLPLTDICNVPNKKSRTDIDHVDQSVFTVPKNPRRSISTEKGPFYGLPDRVKALIQHMKGITDLYQWQKECLNLKAVRDRKNLVYALPTSGGKTLVAEILMLREIVCNKKNAIFILPFVAIVQEKVRSMAHFALELNFLVEEYAAGKGAYPPKKRRRKNSIFICTIEKGLSLINSLMEDGRLNEVGITVVDELHLLGEDGGRGATLEGLLTKIMCSGEKVHIVGMSATIGNLNEVADFLNADVYTQNFRPVELKEYVKCEDDIWLIDLKEQEILTDLKKINYTYSEEASKLDPDRLGGLVMDVVPKDSCLVFCPSRKNCENVALLLTKVLFSSLQEHKKEEKVILLKALEAEGGTLCPILTRTVKFGIAYHHSGLMSDERKLLEEAFRAGTLSVICCTSTLAAGVNLPARRVILRHPYVGTQFLNLSRYKQMIGRAGRAGMGEVGESILICKINEIPKVKELLTSSMDDSLSTMHIEEDRGIKNLILSSIQLGLATTRLALHKLTARTLLGIQQQRLGVSTKKITDKTITTLMKVGAIKVKQTTTYCDIKPNVTVVMPSQESPGKIKTPPPKGKRTVVLAHDTKLEVCQLGRAAMKGSIDLTRAHSLYEDLKIAQRHLVLLDSLHLLYLVTPYDLAEQIKPVGTVYYDVVSSLSRIQMETARVLGINEASINKLRAGIIPKNLKTNVINRFYLTLMLNELWNQQSVHMVAEKYQVNRGIVQHLINASASFASCVVRFCEELDHEFWAFKDLLTTFGKKLSHCCSAELEPLMEIPAVKVGRARQLFNAGYKTLQCIATADSRDMCEKIEYLPKKTATQIIAAAKLLLLEKVENLRDEAENVLDGLDLNHSIRNA